MTEKVFRTQDSTELKTHLAQLPRFKCYACIANKQLYDFGRFFEHSTLEGPVSYALCTACCERIDLLGKKELWLESAFTMSAIHRNVEREIYTPGYKPPPGWFPPKVAENDLNIWETQDQKGNNGI